MSLVVLSLQISFLQFIPMWSCVFCFFLSRSDDQITNSAYSGTRNGSIYASLRVLHIGRRYAWLCFQKDRLHTADATTIPVGSFRRALLMFLYEAYFVWLPTMYFQCAVCAHLCHFLLEHRHSYPSRDEVRCVHVNVLLQFSRGHFIDDASRLFSLHHCMHWSWSAKMLHNLKKFIEDIVYLYN